MKLALGHSLVFLGVVLTFDTQAQLFAPPVTLDAGYGPSCAVACDIRGRGLLDLVIANETSTHDITNYLTVLTNDGRGGFVFQGNLTVGTMPDSIAVLDMNGDGKPDLVCANLYANTLTALTNDGRGGFGLRGTIGTGQRPFSVTAVDVNRDGRLDLVWVNQNDYTLSVLTNYGNGFFGSSATVYVGTRPVFVLAKDLNGDGAPDLVTANMTDGTLTVVMNDGTGSFNVTATLPVGTSPEGVAAVDVNGDGKIDLVSANFGSAPLFERTLTVLTNDGAGSFVYSATLTVGKAPHAVVAVDVNRDGRPDLAAVNYYDNTVTVLTNDGSGGFLLCATIPVGGSTTLCAADLNGDGLVDLFTANTVLFGAKPPTLGIQSTLTNTVLVSWPSFYSGFTMQTNGGCGSRWVDLPLSTADDGTNRSMIVPACSPTTLFRLRR